MAIAKYADVESFAKEQFARAQLAASRIRFAKEAYTLNEEIRATMIAYEPEFASLPTSFGMAAWTCILSVDLRGSSERAVRLGAKPTYLTMHTYMPTMCQLVANAGGEIVGLRGDGLFAAFGLTDTEDEEKVREVGSGAVQDATLCGKAMIEATEEIVSGILEDNGIEGGLRVGVGISVGEIVVTRIGLFDANEVTAYGPPVNQACKLSGQTAKVLLHPNAKRVYPSSSGGRVRLRHYDQWFLVEFPSDMYMLERFSSPLIQKRMR
jgi:class 3 adenylate cyclase